MWCWRSIPACNADPDDLSQIFVRSTNGAGAALAFTHLEKQLSPLAINHQGQFPVVTVSFNLAPGESLGNAVAAIDQSRPSSPCRPASRPPMKARRSAFQASLANEPLLILAALLTVYIVLGVLYESFIHPITILSTLPSAAVGALLSMMLCGMEFSVVALIGIILLIGIVEKNAIMMIDFALDAERTRGQVSREAIYQACLVRFRPILMTTMAAMLGGVPLALGSGSGAELRRPLGVAIVGGLMFSQMLTLYTTPVVYLAFDRRLGRWLRVITHPGHGDRRACPPCLRRRPTHEPFGPVHPPAGRHHPADHRHRPGRRAGAMVSCRCRRFRRWSRRPSRCSASLPGADPGTMASSVATPLERQFPHRRHHRDDLAELPGQTTIVIQFDLNRNIDGAARDVQAAINAAASNLPDQPARTKPTWRKVNPPTLPILILALTSSLYTKGQMYDFASSVLQQKLSQIEGIGQVNVGGGAAGGAPMSTRLC
jgi:multidrug efflux pump subunit AcrB